MRCVKHSLISHSLSVVSSLNGVLENLGIACSEDIMPSSNLPIEKKEYTEVEWCSSELLWLSAATCCIKFEGIQANYFRDAVRG
jgi:hypothetical protein